MTGYKYIQWGLVYPSGRMLGPFDTREDAASASLKEVLDGALKTPSLVSRKVTVYEAKWMPADWKD